MFSDDLPPLTLPPGYTEQTFDDFRTADTIGHPAILTERQTCGACPEQWEGTLRDGSGALVHFYFRMRHGRAQLGVGDTFDAAVADCFAREVIVESTAPGRAGRGLFNDQAERLATFTELLARLEVPA